MDSGISLRRSCSLDARFKEADVKVSQRILEKRVKLKTTELSERTAISERSGQE